MSELKSCPNCGSTAILKTNKRKFYYECSECWTSTKKYWSKKEAAKEWNSIKKDKSNDENIVFYYNGYFSNPKYYDEDMMFHGKILGINDLVDFCCENKKDLELEFHKAVDDYIAFCNEIGKLPETPTLVF